MLPNIYGRLFPINTVCQSVASSRRYAYSAKFQTGTIPEHFVESSPAGFDSDETRAQHELRNGITGLAHGDTLNRERPASHTGAVPCA